MSATRWNNQVSIPIFITAFEALITVCNSPEYDPTAPDSQKKLCAMMRSVEEALAGLTDDQIIGILKQIDCRGMFRKGAG